jgi:hypothetical protein
VDATVWLVLVVLDVGSEGAGGRVGGEDGAVAGVFVKGVAVDCEGGLARGEEEDGAGVCFGGSGKGCFFLFVCVRRRILDGLYIGIYQEMCIYVRDGVKRDSRW